MNLFLFHKETYLTEQALDAGINGIVIDWENKGKVIRQNGFETEINAHTKDTLIDAGKYKTHIMCRVNGYPHFSENEIYDAINLGADEILVPMLKSINQVEKILKIVNNQCLLSILIETPEALEAERGFLHENIHRYYFGLNDLNIAYQSSNLFSPILEKSFDYIKGLPYNFGFAGLTHFSLGKPIPSKLLLAEMLRLGMNFSFLRRSFYRDLEKYTVKEIIESIKDGCEKLKSRSENEIKSDYYQLCEYVSGLNTRLPS